MSSVCSIKSKLLPMGLIIAGSFSGISYAATTYTPVKAQASFQQATRLGAVYTGVFSQAPSSQQAVRANTMAYAPSTGARPQYAYSTPEARRFVQPGRTVVAAAPSARKAVDPAERVIHVGSKQVGTKYRWGGENPLSGFDCSGLVQYSMKKGAGVVLPRTAADQYAVSTKVPASQAMRGDLVFFNTSKRKRISHVGIYLGNNVFLHAPRAGKRIERSEIKGYWRNRLIGFGRIPVACKIPSYYG